MQFGTHLKPCHKVNASSVFGIFCSKCVLRASHFSNSLQINSISLLECVSKDLCCTCWTCNLCPLTCHMMCFSVGCNSDLIASYTTGCSSLLSVEYSQSNTLVCVGVTWSYEHQVNEQDEIVHTCKSSAVYKSWQFMDVCMYFFSLYFM